MSCVGILLLIYLSIYVVFGKQQQKSKETFKDLYDDGLDMCDMVPEVEDVDSYEDRCVKENIAEGVERVKQRSKYESRAWW